MPFWEAVVFGLAGGSVAMLALLWWETRRGR